MKRAHSDSAVRAGSDLVLSEPDFAALAAHIHRETGIFLPPSKRLLLQSRLAKRLRALGLSDFGAYRALLERGEHPGETAHFVSAITTNVTRFMREPHQFDLLREVALPPLVARARAGGRVRLWCAGCATGEEPYSLAIVLLSLFPDAAEHDVRILATDLDPSAVEAATTGRYPASALAAFPATTRQHHFRPVAGMQDHVEVGAALRRLVTCRVLNLLDPWPFRGGFDIIMCRNVVIYFDATTQSTLWRQFAAVQKRPGDWLVIGHSERLDQRARAWYAPERGNVFVRNAVAVTDGAAPLHLTEEQGGLR